MPETVSPTRAIRRPTTRRRAPTWSLSEARSLYGTQSTATAPASNAKRFIEYAWNFTGGGNTFYIPAADFPARDPDARRAGLPHSARRHPLREPDSVSRNPGRHRRSPVTLPPTATASRWAGLTTSRVRARASLRRSGWGCGRGCRPRRSRAKGSTRSVSPTRSSTRSAINTTEDPNAFFNIGGGAPSSPVTSNGYYTSLPRTPTVDPSGWNYVSGLGSPNLIPLAQYATGNETLKPTNNLPPLPPKDCGQPGLASCSGGGGACTVNSGLWTNPAHTATDPLGNSDPQLSLLRGAMSVSGDGDNLRVLLTVSDLTETVPTGAEADEWYGLWSYDGTEYFANAQLTAVPGATPTFGDGTVTKTGNTTTYNPVNTDDTGLLTLGNNGTVEIDVPFSHVGSPPTATILTGPAGSTFIAIGDPGEESALEVSRQWWTGLQLHRRRRTHQSVLTGLSSILPDPDSGLRGWPSGSSKRMCIRRAYSRIEFRSDPQELPSSVPGSSESSGARPARGSEPPGPGHARARKR